MFWLFTFALSIRKLNVIH